MCQLLPSVDQMSELDKKFLAQVLGENVGDLILSCHLVYLDQSVGNEFTKVMVFSIARCASCVGASLEPLQVQLLLNCRRKLCSGQLEWLPLVGVIPS
jgi:hypothetical protein